MRSYKAGEIVELMFPFQEVTGKKIRPALVIKDYGDTALNFIEVEQRFIFACQRMDHIGDRANFV